MRLIDADKIDFNEVFKGASEFAQDTREAAQMLIDAQPTVNESVKGDLISRSALIEKMNDTGVQITFNLPVEELLGEDVDIDDFSMLVQDAVRVYRKMVIDTIQNQPTACNDGWIRCAEQMPPVETEVWIVAKKKWRDGTCKYIITTAMYEDGTVLENDSCWYWEDIDGEWNEEADCMIIPEGWWENKHYNRDGELNHEVDDEVIYWQPLPNLPQRYKENENG